MKETLDNFRHRLSGTNNVWVWVAGLPQVASVIPIWLPGKILAPIEVHTCQCTAVHCIRFGHTPRSGKLTFAIGTLDSIAVSLLPMAMLETLAIFRTSGIFRPLGPSLPFKTCRFSELTSHPCYYNSPRLEDSYYILDALVYLASCWI